MSGYLIMKYILWAFIIYFVYKVIASMILKRRKNQERKLHQKSDFYQKRKEEPIYVGGDYTPIQLNKKHPSYQENLDRERKRAEKRREEERREQERRKNDNDFSNSFDDSAFDTLRRTSTTSTYAHETSSSHHSHHGGDSGGHGSSDSGGSSDGGGGGGD